MVGGSCIVDGDRAQVRVHLIEAANERVVWADGFAASLRDTLFGEGGVAGHIVEAVSAALLDSQCERVERQPLATVEAYALLHGSIRLMHRCSRADFDRAAQCLEHLAERHPRVPEPQAYLAKWHILRVAQGWSENSGADGARAHDRSRRALDANPSSALALAIDGLVTAHVEKNLEGARDRMSRPWPPTPTNRWRSCSWPPCTATAAMDRPPSSVPSARCVCRRWIR